jgi:hypothetical protein
LAALPIPPAYLPILDRTEFDQLKTWLRKAATVTDVSDIFS